MTTNWVAENNRTFLFSPSFGDQKSKIRVLAGLHWALGETFHLLLPTSGGSRASLAGSWIISISALMVMWPSPLCLSSSLPSPSWTLVIGFGVHPSNSGWSYLKTLISSAKTPNKETCTGPGYQGSDISFGGPPINPLQSGNKCFRLYEP